MINLKTKLERQNKLESLAPIAAVMLPEALAFVRWGVLATFEQFKNNRLVKKQTI